MIFVFATFICLMLVGVSEVQASKNCVFGENDTWGFGQVSASADPFIWVAYRWPSVLHRSLRCYLR